MDIKGNVKKTEIYKGSRDF